MTKLRYGLCCLVLLAAACSGSTGLNSNDKQSASSTTGPLRAGDGEFWIEISAPSDEAVVNQPEVDVLGQTLPGAVVSVNDDILLVREDGRFTSRQVLEAGPNLIEIVASNEAGKQLDLMMNVYFEEQ